MDINVLLDKVSISLKQLNTQSYVNNYNMLAARTSNQQFSIVVNESDPLNMEAKLVKDNKSIDDLIMNAIEISSQQKKVITLLNARLELERLSFKGMK